MHKIFLTTLVVLALPAAAHGAVATQPPLDINRLPYQPIGHLKPGEALPSADTGCQEQLAPLRRGEVFNPSGTFNSFDTNAFEVLCFPFRAPGDTTDDDPLGNKGDPRHGFCGGAWDPSIYGNLAPLAGVCDNHQIEWSRYYAATMREVLGDFGVAIHQYAFEVPDPGLTGNTRFGRALNTAAVVPGADNPEESIVIGAHYDKTNDGPASAWDSQEGHAEMIRVAKLMADYWRATGTRPSATIKFIPWDAEESGTFGSLDYATNNVVPGEEFKVRGYWNTDPCAGGYPSYRYGNPLDRLRMGIQIADPAAIGGISATDATRITAFNSRAPHLVQQVLDHIDDTVDSLAGPQPAFLSDAEGNGDVGKTGGIAIGTDRPVLFSSDWRNFEVIGVPFFNPGPEVTGPNQNTDGSIDYGPDQSIDAVTGFHSPLDNLSQVQRFTGGGLAGTTWSGSYAKGMEFCSHLLAWGMLQHDQGGAQTANGDVVAYFEALPNEAKEDQKVTFDAAGSYRYADAAKRARVAADQLEYRWDFGDGDSATGEKVTHAYSSAGRYDAALVVRDRKTGARDEMRLSVTVTPNDVAPPVLTKPAASDEDGTFDLAFSDPLRRGGLQGFVVEESGNAVTAIDEPATALDRWEALPPTAGATIQPWQLSDSSTAKYFGNQKTSDPRSFWTGVTPTDQGYENGPSEGESTLVLREPVALPRGGSVSLFYNSAFVNQGGDSGRVQVAIVEGNAPLEWVTVDTVKVGANDEDSLSRFEELQGDTSFPGLTNRFADLSRFAGRQVRVRFVYALGAPDAAPFGGSRTGWYVDDIKLVGGSFKEIGRTGQGTFTVSGKRKGTYTYRVKALFAGDITSGGSNAERVEVTRGVPVRGESCATAAGFRRLRVVPRGRNVRLDLELSGNPVTAELLRAGRSPRRIARLRRTRSFTVPARGLRDGIYALVLRTRSAGGVTDVRTIALRRARGRLRRVANYTRPSSCGLLSRLALSTPAFTRSVRLSLATTQPARVTVQVRRGSRTVRRFVLRTRANRTVSRTLRGLPRGRVTVRVTAVRGRERVRASVSTVRL